MTNEFIRLFLPVYFLLYFFVLVVLKSLLVKKQIGKNPIVLTTDDSAYGLLSSYFKITMVVLTAYVIVFSAFPQWYQNFIPLYFFEHQKIKLLGVILALVSFVWIIISQNNMRQSWRIGIDLQNKTELITGGVYKISRNPIYVGIVGSLVSLFCITPNVVTLFIALIAFILIQTQIRLEEEHLIKMNGEEFLNYKKQTRRWL